MSNLPFPGQLHENFTSSQANFIETLKTIELLVITLVTQSQKIGEITELLLTLDLEHWRVRSLTDWPLIESSIR